MDLDKNIFPDRKEILDYKYNIDIIEGEKAREWTEKFNERKNNEEVSSRWIEQQKVYFWIRVYLHEEYDLIPNTDVSITYYESGEKLVTKFICYAKKGLEKDNNNEVVNYNPEDDRRVLCLMVDSEKIDKNSDDIPFIRTLFKISRYYSPQILRLNDLSITDCNDVRLDYFDIDF